MIVITPNTNVQTPVGVPICFEASGNVVIPQEDERYIDLPATGTNWTYNSSLGTWKKTGGSIDSADAPATSATGPFGFQPFYIQGSNWTFTTPSAPNRKYGCYIGAMDDNDKFYGWYLWKNCGAQSSGDCNGPNGDDIYANWKAYVIDAGISVNPFAYGINFREEFRVRSDGTFLNWDYRINGVWQLAVYKRLLPTTEVFRYHLNSLYPNNEISFVKTFRGTYQGNVPLNWSTPLGGTLTGTGNTRCFSSNTTGTYRVCVSSEFDTDVCVDIDVDELYFEPIGLESADCVFAGDIVHFTSNGGSAGTLEATSGIVIDSLTWQAPSAFGGVQFTYTLGENEVENYLRVVPRVEILNVEGDTILGLTPGDTFQIITNYGNSIEWRNTNCPNIVSPTGLITIPSPTGDPCFGALDCYIKGVLVAAYPGGEVCDNLLEGGVNEVSVVLRVKVDPVFPSTHFGGAKPTKWKPETPDFRVVVNEFEGGCDETYIRNRTPIYRWTASYSGLAYGEHKCVIESCCEDNQDYVGGYTPFYQTAKRLDDFWNLVAGEYGYFTLKDERTGEVWQRVRFESTMERDHINWYRTQSRTLHMIWRPCCANFKKGGMCAHRTIFTDNEPPMKRRTKNDRRLQTVELLGDKP